MTKTNPELENLISEMKKLSHKEKTNVWKALAKNLEKPSRRRASVNLSKIDKYTLKEETAVIPGKVLSDGDLTKNTTVAAFQFSEKAKEKINKSGKAITFKELMKQNPKGKNLRILK